MQREDAKSKKQKLKPVKIGEDEDAGASDGDDDGAISDKTTINNISFHNQCIYESVNFQTLIFQIEQIDTIN